MNKKNKIIFTSFKVIGIFTLLHCNKNVDFAIDGNCPSSAADQILLVSNQQQTCCEGGDAPECPPPRFDPSEYVSDAVDIGGGSRKSLDAAVALSGGPGLDPTPTPEEEEEEEKVTESLLGKSSAVGAGGFTPFAKKEEKASLNNPLTPSKRSGGGGGTGSPGAGKGFDLGNVSTSGITQGTDEEEKELSEEDGAYAGGGVPSGGGKESKGFNLAGIFGKKSGPLGGTGRELAFGKKDENGNLIEDPDDYFARINPNDSLFRVVTKRYQRKSQRWALQKSRDLLK
tara:strand:- start:1966 stop:2820 length:855 start_codon:yes stop_codon:yes gene_type:complete